MKKLSAKILLLAPMMLIFSFTRAADDQWPKQVTASDGTIIKIYQPTPESFSGNTLKFRSAISVIENGSSDPVFGTFWATSKVETDRDSRQIMINTLNTTDIKIPAITDQNKIDFIDDALETQFSEAVGPISLDEVLTSLEQTQQETKLSQNISTTPPKVIFTTQPSMLVMIDGKPRLKENPEWKLDVVVNTPFTIIKNNEDGQYYLYGSKQWYIASEATGPYRYTNGRVPANISNIEQQIISKEQSNANSANAANNNQNNAQANDQATTVSNIVVSTVPAELIQSKGEPNFTPIQGTSLLYVSNSVNDIFMDENSQQYFVLISGRWYQAKTMTGNNWKYIPADRLPLDFSKIPPGSPKDNVLASVAGTDAAKDAVMDAEIPQTAKVDRNTATTEVTYDGQPKFTDIDGTDLQYAVNTSSTVLRTSNGRFYTVDNGVWFVSDNASGPWAVSTERPDEVDRIPPNSPAYNTKYVYIYDVAPDYVYMGYTPGYLNSYVYGPTVVYGTGYNYDSWFGDDYYPRPWSWGFNYGYNPFCGWSFGLGYDLGWFNSGFGYGFYGGYHGFGGGWWGPSFYHPAYWGGWHGGARPYGYYGRSFSMRNNIRVNSSNNIYRNRGGVVTRSNIRPGGGYNRAGNNRPYSTRPGGSFNNPRPNGVGSRPVNGGNYNRTNGRAGGSIYSDRQGNVYQRGQQGQWQQRQNRNWSPANNARPEVIQNLNRQQVMRDRGQVRTQ
ncbi:MAG TPA: hypothetical protein VFC34_13750, partial [Puia sp.]|nr:hypothetical protein [Puia sp.]